MTVDRPTGKMTKKSEQQTIDYGTINHINRINRITLNININNNINNKEKDGKR